MEDARTEFSKELTLKKSNQMDLDAFDYKLDQLFMNNCLRRIKEIKNQDGPQGAIQKVIEAAQTNRNTSQLMQMYQNDQPKNQERDQERVYQEVKVFKQQQRDDSSGNVLNQALTISKTFEQYEIKRGFDLGVAKMGDGSRSAKQRTVPTRPEFKMLDPTSNVQITHK